MFNMFDLFDMYIRTLLYISCHPICLICEMLYVCFELFIWLLLLHNTIILILILIITHKSLSFNHTLNQQSTDTLIH